MSTVLALLDLPGLRVALLAVSGPIAAGFPDALPPIEPLDPASDHPMPSFLPAGLTPHRIGEGYCALDAQGQLMVSWIALDLPPNEPLPLAWNPADGPTPKLQALNLDGCAAAFLPAAWSAVSPDRLPLIALRASPTTCWLVGGRLGHVELARVAASLLKE
ncbi:hypothetical protein [Candidatus Oscillochloris fontis]|uniref:hypothetical protein n=1 Tax=Candidatus Oscillochloris fontis TaxID=2496868 RepID=UPI00101B8238|nr:hypothetical protein [Candidatus Oscillochloris fontis]